MNRRARSFFLMMAAVIVLFMVVGALVHGRKGAPVIQDEVPFKLISFGATMTELESYYVDTYTLTIAYPDEGSNKVTVIAVPRSCLVRDETLETNTVVWDRPTKIQGIEYRFARWNPETMYEKSEEPVILEGKLPVREK